MSHPIHEANENSPYGNLTKEQFYHKHQISHQETFMINKQNMRIFTQSWQPAGSNPSRLKGLIAMIHGYTLESGWLFELNAVAMAKAGFFVCALDLQGHGLSEGPREHITDIQPLVQDCIQYFCSARADHPSLPHFLYGESLGAAIAVLICLQQKDAAWKGLIAIGAMCEVSKKFKPIWPLEKFLPAAAFVAPAWSIPFMDPPLRRSYKESWKRKLGKKSPNRKSSGRTTAASGLQLLRVCEYIKRNCSDLEVAMLVLHGGDDVVCDPEGAKHLYESAASKDKSLKIYEGMWHLWIGEPNESVEEVFETILSWIEFRSVGLTNSN
ncbi:caffeoylshikimate esterase [Phtheirospermum japonicum]|uniref:Caffeoylshikimate esterase n=1 Tax=Phtheirospermum japonicum TaxID=374723 RepID=A0A830CJK0_9LAMI|nr:caffeoylshikimate esterase [Phtheirospermum japonicum]